VIGWFLLAAAAAEPPTDHVLGEGFPFCTEPARGGAEVLRFCPLLEGLPPDRCPGLRETCASGVVPPEESAGCADPGTFTRPDSLAGAPGDPEPEPPQLELPEWGQALQSLARWVMAFLVAALVLLLFRFLVRSFGRRRAAPVDRSVPASAAVAAPADEELPAAPVADVLSAARTALAEGRFDEVVVLARGAALKHLSESGKLVLHRARTDREYVRAMRAHGETGQSLGVIARAREALLFGRRPVDGGLATAVLAAAERIVAAALVLFLLAGEAQAADPRYGPHGDAALPRLLQAWGYAVTWRLRSLDELDAETDVLVLDLYEVEPSADQFGHLRTWVEGGGVLWMAGSPPVGFDELGPTVETLCVPEIDPQFSSLSTPRAPGELAIWLEVDQAVVWCGEGAAVQVRHLGEGVVVAFADPVWLRNGAYVDPGTERFVGDLLHTGRFVDRWPTDDPARIELATYAATQAPPQGGNNPLRSVANARLLPFVLQLLLAFGVLAAWRGWAFAPLRDPANAGRRSFSEHVRALGVRLWRARASGVAARSLARYWHGRLGVAGLVLAAEQTGRGRSAAAEFAREVEARATGDGRPSRNDHVFMEELWTITRARTP
jgi:hypothetical protein